MKSMTSRERVLTTFNHQEPDKIPIDLGSMVVQSIHRDAHAELKKHLGITGGQEAVISIVSQCAVVDPRLQEKFQTDIIGFDAKGPSTFELKITTDEKGYSVFTDEWGVVRACPPGGFYYDIIDSPLKNPTLSDLEKYPWPDPLDPGRLAGLDEKAKELYEGTDKCIVFSPGASIFATIGYLMDWAPFYRACVSDQPLIKAFVEHLTDFYVKLCEAAMKKFGKFVQVVMISDDLTYQQGLLVRKSIIRDLFMPSYKKIIDAIKSNSDAKVLFHICGSSYLVHDLLIEVGVDAVHPVQVSAEGMDDTASLKKEWGDKLVFWGGGIDTQHVLPFGTPEEVRREVRRRILDLAPGGGYIFGNVHNIQRGVPPENIVAFFEEAIKWRDYPIKVDELAKEI